MTFHPASPIIPAPSPTQAHFEGVGQSNEAQAAEVEVDEVEDGPQIVVVHLRGVRVDLDDCCGVRHGLLLS